VQNNFEKYTRDYSHFISPVYADLMQAKFICRMYTAGIAATEFWCGGRFCLPYSAVYLQIQKWKNHWNRSTYAKVIV